MKPAFALLFLPLLVAAPARAVTPEAEAFMAALKALAPVSCERRRLRRERALRERFDEIVRDPEDLRAIGAQQRELFAQCE